MEHLDALPANANLVEQILNVFHPPFRLRITFQVMACSFQSARDQNTILAALERAQSVQHVQFAGAGQQHNAHVGRVLNARRAREIRRRVRTKVAAEGEELRFKGVGCTHHLHFPSGCFSKPQML